MSGPGGSGETAASGTCNRCGLVFPTEARTNTRCRRRRHVVNIGRTPKATSAPDDTYDGKKADLGLASPLVVGLALAGGGVWCLRHGWHLRPAEGADPERVRHSRLRCGLGRAVLVGAGVWVVVASMRD